MITYIDFKVHLINRTLVPFLNDLIHYGLFAMKEIEWYSQVVLGCNYVKYHYWLNHKLSIVEQELQTRKAGD